MKTVLVVTDAWPPQVNGVVRVLDALIPRLEARGYKVVVVEPGQFRTFSLPFVELRFALFPYRSLWRLIKALKPDAVHIVTEGPLGLAARGVCQAQRVPFTTWYHSHFQLYLHARYFFLLTPVQVFMRWFHSAAEQTIVSTESLRDELAAAGFKNLAVVPLGVDTDLFVRTAAGGDGVKELPKPVFVYFSRLAPEKNPEEFMRLELPGTKLVIGDGPDRKKLEKEYGETHTFVGYKKGQELVDWLSLADVFVFPSLTETFGLVALEALSCGLPVAAHNVMGPRDVIEHGRDGFLGDDLQDAALKCLDLSPEDCRKKAEQFTWDRSVDRFLEVLFPEGE